MDKRALTQLLQQANGAREFGDYQTAVSHFTQLLDQIAMDSQDPVLKEMRLEALAQRGRTYYLLDQSQESLADYEQYYAEAGSSNHAVTALNLIGEVHYFRGDHQESLAAHQEALEIAEALNYSLGKAKAFGGMGTTLERLGRVDDGIMALRKAQAIFEQLDDIDGVISCGSRLGFANFFLGRFDQAISAFGEALILARKHDLLDMKMLLLNNLGETYQLLFDMDKALAFHTEGLALAERTQSVYLADLRRNMGIDLMRLGRTDEALSYLYQALELVEQSQHLDVHLQTLYALALAEMNYGDIDRGKEHLQEYQKLAKSHEAQGYQADALYLHGYYCQKIGDLATAESLWQEASFKAHENKRRWLLWRIHAGLAGIAHNESLALAHFRIAADVVHQIAYPIEDKTLQQHFLDAPPIKAILEKAPL